MAQPAIQIKGLTKEFESKKAVDDLDLEIKRGDVFGFLGPNGAGKTTTMKMLVGLLQPTSGTVRIMGKSPSIESLSFKSRIGYLPENIHLYEKLNGLEHLDMMGKLFNLEDQIRKKRIEDIISLFDLKDCANRFTETYSKGQKQKLALGMTLIHDPEILILDEPTSGLDPKAARLIREIILQLKEEKTTIILSTHMLDVVVKVCETAGIIYNGRMVAKDTVKRLNSRKGSLEDTFIDLTGGMDRGDLKKWRSRKRLR